MDAGNYRFGLNPIPYAQDELKRFGAKRLPVDEHEMADFLGYEIKEIDHDDTVDYPGIRDILDIACGFLVKDRDLILVNGEMSLSRKRMTAFHEFPHVFLPWHQKETYACGNTSVDFETHVRMEREAFQGALEMMMPYRPFVDDSLSLPVGTDAVKSISKRYGVSLEATSIRYARTNPKPCAIMVLAEPDAIFMENAKGSPKSGQPSQLPLFNIDRYKRLPFVRQFFPLVVKYFVRSETFLGYVRPGYGFDLSHPFFMSFNDGKISQGEITASALGSSRHRTYLYECCPLFGKMMLVLLWQNHGQLGLDLEWAVNQ